MIGPEIHDRLDLFISYAREDYQPAKEIADRLQACITRQGVPPRIFLDVSRDSMPVGTDWQKYMEEALRRSEHIVTLYSNVYFTKDFCRWELQRAVDLYEAGSGRLVPVLLETAAKDKIPFTANRYSWLPVTRTTWFEDLREALGLRPAVTARRLRFATTVTDAVVNHTLPTIRVVVTGPDDRPVLESGESVALDTHPVDPALNGTLVAPTVRGEAIFADLSFQKPLESVRLVARAAGCESALTPPIQVTPPTPQPVDEDPQHPAVPAGDRAVFFPDGRSLAILDGRSLTIHPMEGPSHADPTQLVSRPRLWARGVCRLAVADWTGRVVLAAPDGRTRTVDLAGAAGLTVPGALAFDGDTLLIGMWNGTIWSLSSLDEKPTALLTHPAGVQILAVQARPGDGKRLLVGGLDGTLTVYEDGRPAAEHRFEPLLLGIMCQAGHTLVVGEHHVYRLDDGTSDPLEVELPARPLTDTLLGTQLSIALNADGLGVCFDAELGVHLGFRAVPGARIVCATHDGRLVVFAYPDGSHVLMRDGRIGVTSAHPIAISQDGRLAASSDGKQTIVLPIDELHTGGPEFPSDRDAE